VDSQTRHALKEDKFVYATTTGLSWLEVHRAQVVRASIAAAVILAALIGGIVSYERRSTEASIALGQALEIYNTALRQPGEPDDGTYLTVADRAKAANAKFVQVADQYGSLEAGKTARYFAGLTDIDLGKTAEAETNLKSVSSSWNEDLASLAKIALAGLYVQTGKTPQAVDLYKQIIAKPTDTVPASAAQLQLAQLYEKTDPQQAKQIYAVLKDKDKATAAGQIAAQKLNPASAQQGLPPQ
jgi:predicted negative regulator of RcsB-dependent stress response